MSKRTVNRLQNLVLVALSLSALFLLSRIPLFGGKWANQVHAFLTSPAAVQEEQNANLSSALAAVHIVVTSDSEYGRYSQLYTPVDSALFQQVGPLFQEALGSASEVGATADKTLQEALSTPSIYIDLTTELPLEAVAAWLGEETPYNRSVRAMALTTEESDSAVLYLYSGDGSIFRYYTALPLSAVQDAAAQCAPNSGAFGFESNYTTLAPYTVLTTQAVSAPVVQAALPTGYSSYNLLTALDFNAHTGFRYQESSGAEVITESPRTLRLDPDGTVSYSGSEDAASSLYRVAFSGEEPTTVDALQSGLQLAAVLTGSTGASSLYLRSIDATDTGWQLSFGYQAAGFPVFFPDGEEALTITITGRTIVSFTYRCRTYTALEENSALLPTTMAIAIASLHPGSGLSLGYIDNGNDTLSAFWLEG